MSSTRALALGGLALVCACLDASRTGQVPDAGQGQGGSDAAPEAGSAPATDAARDPANPDAPIDVPYGDGAACAPARARCSSAEPCCGGHVCAEGVCVPEAGVCRARDERCARNEDCCLPLLCDQNRCVRFEGCAGPGAACESTPQCCSGLSCAGGRCQPPAGGSCGDGTCAAGESPATCCVDCPCVEAGYQCALQTRACVRTASSQRFELVDACDDDRPIQFRVFDRTNVIVWPRTSAAVYKLPSLTARYVDVPCTPGAQLCFGAEPDPEDGRAWGLGLSANKTCAEAGGASGCCAVCGSPPSRHLLACP